MEDVEPAEASESMFDSPRAAWNYLAALENLCCEACGKAVRFEDRDSYERARRCLRCAARPPTA